MGISLGSYMGTRVGSEFVGKFRTSNDFECPGEQCTLKNVNNYLNANL
jgi:hypothetical protein